VWDVLAVEGHARRERKSGGDDFDAITSRERDVFWIYLAGRREFDLSAAR
jgi:hypothetical protein